MSKRKRINIGSISHGTMRVEDLIPSFLDELLAQTPTRRAHVKLAREIESRLKAHDALHDLTEENAHDCNDDGHYWCNGDAHSDLEELFDALNEYAPSYFYFGAHPGDGSDYGFWLSEDFEHEFDGLKVSCNGMRDTYSENGEVLDITCVPVGYTGEVLRVNDHGNTSLFRYVRGRAYHVWSVV